jgi:hypothetical protein
MECLPHAIDARHPDLVEGYRVYTMAGSASDEREAGFEEDLYVWVDVIFWQPERLSPSKPPTAQG